MSDTKACLFCAEEIKADALKCKHCGSMVDGKPQVIEKTSKRYKRHMLNAMQLAGLGFLLLFFGYSSSLFPVIGVWMMLGGTVYYVWARYKAWWHHG